MSKKLTVSRVEVVGSFLRSKELKEARRDFSEGKITNEELRKIEDVEIEKLIEKQKEVGLKYFTDGEYRRSWWHLDFFWGLNGIEKELLEEGYVFADEITRGESARVVGKISGKNHPFVEDYKFIKKFEDEKHIARQTIPAPAQFLEEIDRNDINELKKIYSNRKELLDDIINAYRDVIKDLYDAGARTIQVDDCTWGHIVNEIERDTLRKDENRLTEIIDEFLYINNGAIDGWPEDLLITTHVCRGNYHSTYFAKGSYDAVSKALFSKENVDGYYLEYDTERAGGFEPLSDVSENKFVVLGIITSKFPELEDKEKVKERIKEATKYVPLERLSLSPQCGFASTEEGNILTEEEQWNKIKLIKEIAEEVWGE